MTTREFESGFRRLYLPLGMYAMRITGDADVAEDLVQDAFERAWLYIGRGGRIDSLTAFMYRSVRNVCMSHLRDRRETVDIDALPDEVTPEEIDTSVRDARIWRAIDALPRRCREVFLMSKRDGLTNQEIADELGISLKTVKNQLTKAFSRLRDALAGGHRPFFLPFL